MNKVTAGLALGLYHEGYSSGYISEFLSTSKDEIDELISGVSRSKQESPLKVTPEAKKALKAQASVNAKEKPTEKAPNDSCYGVFSMFRETRLGDKEWVPVSRGKSSGKKLCRKKNMKRCPTEGCSNLIYEDEECCQACYQLQLVGRPALTPSTQYVGGDHFWS